jgi:hypothetical protein
MSMCGLYRIAYKQSGNYMYHLVLPPWSIYLLLIIPEINPKLFCTQNQLFRSCNKESASSQSVRVVICSLTITMLLECPSISTSTPHFSQTRHEHYLKEEMLPWNSYLITGGISWAAGDTHHHMVYLTQVHSAPFQSAFFTHRDLVLPFSVSIIFPVP